MNNTDGPEFPEGTPEHDAYREQFRDELAKFAAGAAPYQYPKPAPQLRPRRGQVNVRRLPATTMLWMSPELRIPFSNASKPTAPGLDPEREIDPEVRERLLDPAPLSRATIVRILCGIQEYKANVIDNVIETRVTGCEGGQWCRCGTSTPCPVPPVLNGFDG